MTPQRGEGPNLTEADMNVSVEHSATCATSADTDALTEHAFLGEANAESQLRVCTASMQSLA